MADISIDTVLIIMLIAMALAFGHYARRMSEQIRTLQRRVVLLEAQAARLPAADEVPSADAAAVESAAEVSLPAASDADRTGQAAVHRDEGSTALSPQIASCQHDEAALEPEIIAAIMAAVTACGYSPAAVRGIRKKTTIANEHWVMAGRLAGVR